MLERINSPLITLMTSVSALLFSVVHANDANSNGLLTLSVEQATNQVKQACPKIWEDLGTDMSDDLNPSGESLWGLNETTELDKEEYAQFLAQLTAGDSTNSNNDPFSNTERIRVHCTTARTALLNIFYSSLPQSVVASMPELEYEPGPAVDGFLVGDIRQTGRRDSAEGWLFLTGQTIGPIGSTAQLKGDDYRALYEVAKHWWLNGGENAAWDDNDVVTLPDMRGRVVVARDDMGGTAKGLLDLPHARTVGGYYGSVWHTLTIHQLPSHRHSLAKNGAHNHTMSAGGIHTHKQKVSAFSGTNTWGTHKWGGEVKGRTRAENTLTDSIQASPSHSHTVHNSSTHGHTIGYTGSGQQFSKTQPSMTFNVEMKYK